MESTLERTRRERDGMIEFSTRKARGSAGVAAALGIVLLTSGATQACQIPVFRYALERWEADPYVVTVYHKGDLSADAKALVARLHALARPSETAEDEYAEDGAGEDGAGKDGIASGLANVQIRSVDLTATAKSDAEGSRAHERLVERFGDPGLPALALEPPDLHRWRDPVWFGSLNESNVETLVDSPARREIVERLLAGDSVVWLLLESGNPSADDKAFAVLEETLKLLENELSLPDLEDIVGDEEYQPDVAIELKLKFSALRVSRQSPQERIFVELIQAVEADLHEFAKVPIAIPIFGRGRALWGLTGEGVHPDPIGKACSLLISACSCTVKSKNPGVDLVFAVDWNGRVKGDAAPASALPELPALAAAVGESSVGPEASLRARTPEDGSGEVSVSPSGAPSGAAPETSKRSPETGVPPSLSRSDREGGFLVPLVVVFAGALAIVLVGSFFLLRSREG